MMKKEVQAESTPRVSSDEQREHLMVQAAKLYYDMERTQSEIAKELGLTRWQVGRLIHDAREIGLVRIEIVPRSPRRPDLEIELQHRFHLREAIVTPVTIENDGIILETIAQAAAQYVAALYPRPKAFGMSWGRTMGALVRWMPQNWNQGLRVVVLNGGPSRTSSPTQPSHVASRLAETGNGDATILPVPAILGLTSTKEALEKDPVVAEVLILAEQVPIACYSLGALSKDSVLVEAGNLTSKDVELLKKKGAVGDILGRFIDVEGKIADESIDSRTIGLDPKDLRKKAYSICVAGGKGKHQVVRAGLTAGYMNVLITDDKTAAFLLRSKK
jgi:deoxyribonucleoside regulator